MTENLSFDGTFIIESDDQKTRSRISQIVSAIDKSLGWKDLASKFKKLKAKAMVCRSNVFEALINSLRRNFHDVRFKIWKVVGNEVEILVLSSKFKKFLRKMRFVPVFQRSRQRRCFVPRR